MILSRRGSPATPRKLRRLGASWEMIRHEYRRARTLHASGIKPLDALHLASALEAQADSFCTCDDRFLTRAKALATLPTKVVSPLELIEEVTR
ncbi:MAG: PIN domain-containing protein [Candidatus Entotheonellia bacterium]